MSFPKLEVPVLVCTLPVSGKKVSYRPYTVKEDKILNLIATEKDQKQLSKDIVKVVNDLAKACTFNEQDIDNFPVSDIEYLFLKIKIASSGSIRKKIYSCKLKNNKGEECGASNTVEVDLDAIKLNGAMPDNKVKLSSTLTLILKPPSFKDVQSAMDTTTTNAEASLKTLAASVELVLDGDEVYSDFTSKELIDNILINMTESQLNKMKGYFDAMPELVYKKDFVCKGCGSTHNLEVKHLVNFFG